jgi:hypothetical protein
LKKKLFILREKRRLSSKIITFANIKENQKKMKILKIFETLLCLLLLES